MAVWTLIAGSAIGLALGGPLGALTGAVVGGLVTRALSRRAADPERRQVAFTIAAIALAAKMASSDGHASDREYQLFQRLFHVPDSEQANAARFYRMAGQSTDGYEAYARQVAELLGPGSAVLEDLLEALLMIATVDGVHEAEVAFLDRAALLMGFSPAQWAAIKVRHIALAKDDPHAVLGVLPGASRAEIRAAYHALARQYHPDRHLAEGTPPEFIRVAEMRMATINDAWAELSRSAP